MVHGDEWWEDGEGCMVVNGGRVVNGAWWCMVGG